MDMRLAEKGQGEPRAGLVEQGHVQVALAREVEAPLAAAGWPKEKTDALEAGVASLESDASVHAENKQGAHGTAASERAALGEVKTFVRKVRHAVPMALRAAPGSVEASAFHAGGPLGRSTPKHVKYLGDIRGAVVKLDEQLGKYLSDGYGGKKPSEVLDTLKAALSAADAKQETALSALPKETLALYETKGRVLEAIEDLNRVAKIAFDGDAATIARFNKDVLLRARKARKNAAPK